MRQPLEASQRDRIAAGLPFVESLARRVAASMPHSIELGDLVQDGMLGLIDAACRFDEARGIKFETFAERRVRGAMIDALRRGVKIEIITPGADIDARTVRAVGKARWKPLLQAGARFYEYQPARFHCKYLLVDDCWASFGSANLDNRSMSLNEEANLNVLDRQFVTSYAKIFEKDKSHAHEVTLQDWRHRPWEEKIKGRAMSIFRSQM